MTLAVDPRAVRRRVRARLLGVGPEAFEGLSPPERRLRVRREVLDVLREERAILPTGEISEVVNQVSDEVVGLGPIERLLKDPEVSEVMVNGADDVYVEREGRIERVEGRLFEGEDQVFHLIERIVSPLGLRVDESSPFVDARLPDGARVNAIIPPLSLCGPCVTIRKFTMKPLGPRDLVRLGSLTEPMMDFLGACVRAKGNVVVSGGTGSGKTTLLGGLTSFIPESERLITIEDAAELRLTQPNVVSLEARPPNVEGAGEITVRTLLRNALRMRPDRIIVGEVRGGEALDMLQAMNTGHEGSLSTAHANSPRDLLSRLETMALMSDVDLPVSHVREQIAGALDLIVHMNRLPDGRRMVSRVAAVEGLREGSVRIDDVFVWRRGPRGGFKATGVMPSVLRMLSERDERVDPRIFGRLGVDDTSEARSEASAAGAGSADVNLQAPSPVVGRPRSSGLRRTSRRPSPWTGSLRRLGSILE
ncbi:MAG TPA: CpaF family protein [Actinomycetota bacterium]|nr:CpaF family protein [Actinomycetota bacterium]